MAGEYGFSNPYLPDPGYGYGRPSSPVTLPGIQVPPISGGIQTVYGGPQNPYAEEGGRGFLGDIGSFLGEHPEVILGVGSIAANVWGAHKEGQARDKELEWRRKAEEARLEEERKRRRSEELLTVMGLIGRGPRV